MQCIKINLPRVLLTFVREPYPRVGAVSRTEQNQIQQHQRQVHSPNALSHLHLETLLTIIHIEILQVDSMWSAKSTKKRK